MPSLQPDCYALIEKELSALRQAIARSDLAGIREHSAATRELLAQLRPLLERSSATASHRLLWKAVYRTAALLARAKRTTQALQAVYQSFATDEERHWEPL